MPDSDNHPVKRVAAGARRGGITPNDWVSVLACGVVIFFGRLYDFGFIAIFIATMVAVPIALFVFHFIKAVVHSPIDERDR